jgi:ABC-type arginine/histidine transport system permease subunit
MTMPIKCHMKLTHLQGRSVRSKVMVPDHIQTSKAPKSSEIIEITQSPQLKSVVTDFALTNDNKAAFKTTFRVLLVDNHISMILNWC